MFNQILAAIGVLALTSSAAFTSVAQVTPGVVAEPAQDLAAEYHNPLTLKLEDGLEAEQCADPDVIRSKDPLDQAWYLFCTRDALHSELTEPDGSLKYFSIPTYRSTDLVTWSFVGESLPERPAWIGDGDMWAPDVAFIDGKYLLYYTATETVSPGGPAIGVAVSDSPMGPWVDSGGPVVEPMPPIGGSPDERRWVFDPEVLTVEGVNYIYFGSYFGGISVRELSRDGLTSDPESQVEVTIGNRYEGAHVIERDGWFYLLASATNCCAGPVTGYSVFAGRSKSPMGPFVDQAGVSLLAGRVGGTPVLHQNGNRWIGTGHHSVVTDYSGQQWIFYHAVDRFNPYMEGASTYTRRPVLMDPLDWVDGWPVVRGGHGPSDSAMPGPAAQPGQKTLYSPSPAEPAQEGPVIVELSDSFEGSDLAAQWEWNRVPASDTFSLSDGTLRWETQPGDLDERPENPTSVLFEDAPDHDFMVDVELSMTLPEEGCCQNYVQAGLILAEDEGNFVKFVTASIWETRQTEFARRTTAFPAEYPSYGNSVGGPVGENTILRIVRTQSESEILLTGLSSIDGTHWDEAGTWAMPLEADLRIGLVSMGGAGYEAIFDSVTVRELAKDEIPEPEPEPEPIEPPDPTIPPEEDPVGPPEGGDESPSPLPNEPENSELPDLDAGEETASGSDLSETGSSAVPIALLGLVVFAGAFVSLRWKSLLEQRQ